MKKRKGSLLQRMMAVLLSAVLVVSMAFNDVSMTVLAQENTESLTPDGQQENAEENTVDTVEGDEETEEETEKKSVEETDPEEQEPEDEIKQEMPEPEEETNPEETEKITVDEAGQNVQALLERIAALPDVEEYLAAEPDADDWAEDDDAYEEAYTEWMAGLYDYTEEALAIQEAVEELSEEEQAEIPEEALAKLAAWAEAAQTAEESTQVMTAESSMVMAADGDTSGTCGDNLTWTLADGVLTISGSGAMRDYKKSDAPFMGSDIKTVVINEGVTSIGIYAFCKCSGLTSITIPASVKNIKTCAFLECGSLTSIAISEGVESIGSNAFCNCNSLTSITIPVSVESIGSNAFYECSKLTRVELSGNLTAINSNTFWECSSLTSITIPAGVTSIGNSAFNGCSSLTSITIPAGVISIGQSAFNSCSSLTEVTMESKTPPLLGNNVFYNCGCIKGNTKGIHVPAGTADTYKQAAGWSNYKDNITDGTHSHSWSSAWTTNETHHWHDCPVTDCPVTDNADKDGYGEHVYDNDSDTTCNTCGYTRTLQDTQPPTGEIKIEGHSWTQFLKNITFKYFFSETKQVTITAKDTGSGVDKIYYYISNYELESEEDLKWLEWTEGSSFSIDPDKQCVIYVKITDKAGNVTYLSTDGLVFDATPPVISGVTDGGTYNEPQTVTVTDAMFFDVKSVTVNGTEVTLTGDQFTLGTADGPQTIVATDQAGNTTTVTVTVTTKAQTYTVKVVGGSGSGNYPAGDTVTITANPPESGKQFDRWLVGRGSVTLAESTSSTTTFTMPAGVVEVTATYKDSVSDADKLAAAKTVVEAALNGVTPTNATTEAEIMSVINTALSNTGITDVTVTIAKFRKTEATTSAAGSILVDVSIKCGREEEGASMNKPIAQLTAGKYTVAVNGGTGGGEYAVGATVTVTANAPASGQQFDKWTVNSGSVTLANAASSTTTFTMPAEAVSVTATYKTNTGGGSGDSGSGDHSGGGGNSDHSGSNGNSGSGNNNNDIGGESDNNGGSGSSGGNDITDGGGYSGANGNNITNTPAKVPTIVITTQPKNLEDAVLTEPEKQQKAAGADIRIELDVKVATAEASAADRALVEEALRSSAAGYTLGQYLDISLYKVIGDSRTAIRETDGKITIRIDVPDALKNTDSSRVRTFAVIRVHDGRTEFLADLDTDNDTITIETDRFSTYAVIYKDTADGGNSGSIQLSAESGSGKGSGGAKDNEPKTGDATPLELSATLAMIAGFAYLLLYFADRERGMTEERKKELVSQLVGWAKRGGRIRKYLALAAIFVLLVYYHSIGKKTCTEWKAIYGE